MAGRFDRFFYALGKGARAMKDSAEARVPGEPPPEVPVADAPDQPITLVRCPKCGGYGPAGQRCTCA